MSDGFYVGAIGLGAQQRALDVIANNIANVNTPGFKRNQLRFYNLIASQSRSQTAAADLAQDVDQSAGVALDSSPMLNDAGEIERTGRAMDLAIDGKGFIELMGPAGQTLLWRGGNLKVNEDGLLAATNGMALRAGITVPADATVIAIAADGRVTALVPDSADPVEIGQIELVRLDDVASVERMDGEIYRVREGASLTQAAPGEEGLGSLAQGAVEKSNTALNDEMVALMMVQRAYAANAQIVQAADQLMAIANGLRR